MTTSLPARMVCAAANHLLAQQPGLHAILQTHAGKTVRLDLPLYTLQLRIDPTGAFEPATETNTDTPEAASIQVDQAVLLHLPLQGRDALRQATAVGDAHFLDALHQVFRQLDWDAEADLSSLLGPIAGVRVARLVQSLPAAVGHGVQTLLANLADYATEEAGYLTSKRDVRRFNRDVDLLANDCARLEARVKHLEQG